MVTVSPVGVTGFGDWFEYLEKKKKKEKKKTAVGQRTLRKLKALEGSTEKALVSCSRRADCSGKQAQTRHGDKATNETAQSQQFPHVTARKHGAPRTGMELRRWTGLRILDRTSPKSSHWRGAHFPPPGRRRAASPSRSPAKTPPAAAGPMASTPSSPRGGKGRNWRTWGDGSQECHQGRACGTGG